MSGRSRSAIGVVLSLLLLAWALRDVSAAEVVTRIRAADPILLGLAILIALAGFWFRAVRWGVVLRPVDPTIKFRPRLAATFIGFAANNLLPARVGEFARAFTLGRLSSVSTPAAFATLVVERLVDALVLVGLLFAAMATPGFPVPEMGPDVRWMAAAALTLLTGAVVVVVLAPKRTALLARGAIGLLPTAIQPATLAAARGFAQGLAVLRNPALFALSAALGLSQWVFLAISFLLGFRAFGIDEVPFVGAIFLQSVVSLAVAVPSTPGFFGPFEAATKVALAPWDIPADQVVAFAIGFHIAGFLPVTLIGAYYVWRMNIRWAEVRHSDDGLGNRE
jgi:glycosyltransferase 2 family protein